MRFSWSTRGRAWTGRACRLSRPMGFIAQHGASCFIQWRGGSSGCRCTNRCSDRVCSSRSYGGSSFHRTCSVLYSESSTWPGVKAPHLSNGATACENCCTLAIHLHRSACPTVLRSSSQRKRHTTWRRIRVAGKWSVSEREEESSSRGQWSYCHWGRCEGTATAKRLSMRAAGILLALFRSTMNQSNMLSTRTTTMDIVIPMAPWCPRKAPSIFGRTRMFGVRGIEPYVRAWATDRSTTRDWTSVTMHIPTPPTRPHRGSLYLRSMECMVRSVQHPCHDTTPLVGATMIMISCWAVAVYSLPDLARDCLGCMGGGGARWG